MTLTLTGSNTYLLKKRLDALVANFVKEHGDLALERIDAAEASPEQVLDAVASVPFLASKKMVVLKDPSQNKAIQEGLEQLISSTSPSTELIIYDPKTDKRTAFYKTLKSKTQLEEVNDLAADQLPAWLVEEAKKKDASLSRADAMYMVDRLGTNQSILASELDKLALYNPEITRASIDLNTEQIPQSKIFDLLDTTFAGKTSRALELYEQQRAQKVEPQAILSLIIWQLQLIALAKTGKGKSAAQIASEAGGSPYPITKAQQLAAKLSDEKLRQMINQIAEIDHKSKIKTMDVGEAIKSFMVSI